MTQTVLTILLNILKFIFIDEAIATCSAKSCGTCGKYMIGFLYRVLEFGTISAVPPIILINYSDKYSTIIAAIASFFGMKFFTKLVEFLSQESVPSMMKQLKEENKNIMLAISKLPTDMQTIINTELTELNNKTQKISDNIDSLKDDMKSLKTDFESSLQPYVPYDSPSNGD